MEENNVKLLIFLEVKKHLQARKGKTRSRGTNSRFAVCRKHDSKSLYSLLDWTKEVRSSRKSSLGRSGGGAGKGRRACNYVAQYLSFCIENVDANCWLAEMTLVMTSLPLTRLFQCLFSFALVSASRWLAKIWQHSRRGTTGDLEFQRRGCKLSFLFPLRRQSATESLLEG